MTFQLTGQFLPASKLDLCDPCKQTSGCEDKESKELARRANEQVQAAMQSLEAGCAVRERQMFVNAERFSAFWDLLSTDHHYALQI